ncbi:lytic transglycosylase domain-containing protein [Aequorivita antarctica]|uniref:Lytic transglycosylase domain-containing protein n=1 Tax=Aequorivita antarctica TaxID=153266 RepID=A0A5C6Z0A5_9FLAO|nr:lytic transglycosylase domain-containing protein [Aequorivita antarctica]TXD73424.1 lytic transglycosylase domain-containing protein [Aequorivita antarctica]SRX76356.1 Membrane-bound lytic murein transglycosylase D [Aequorivita antarctica]
MKTIGKIGLGLVVLAISAISIHAVQDAPTDENFEKKLVNDYNVYALPLPEKMDFAGEPVPLKNPDIRERMDRELLVNTYWQSNGLLLFKRANKYFPLLEPLLKKYGLPDDFKYLAVAESGLEYTSSPVGASGIWHFMKGTGLEYGLEINDYVDERYNLDKATMVAAEYLKKSKEKFGSWTMAAASYNAGVGGMNKQINRQKETSYYDLLLNDETSRYVFRILALKEIMTHPQQYGFNYREKDLYTNIPTFTVKVNTPVEDWAEWIKPYGINYKILKLHNPWLRDTYLKNTTGKEYFIEIPEKGYYQ